MSACRYDREAKDYLKPDGDPCRTDDYGDPTRHCTMRRCSNHVGPGELTCARCLGRVRANLRRIPVVSRLMMLIALEDGVDSDAANLAGPATDPQLWEDRRIAMRRHLTAWESLGRITEKQAVHALGAMEDDDQEHPYLVLGRWDLMLREDYGHPSEEAVTIDNAAAYIDRILGRVAQDDDQDFPLLAHEIKACRNHIERVLHSAVMKQRGAPCPECVANEDGVPRLVREYGHWCDDEDCERIHYDTDEDDRWVCPRNRQHEWTPKAYSDYIEERQATRKAAS